MFHTLFCPLDCYCVLTIACPFLLTFCTCLIVLCRTMGSIGISRVLCTPWSTSSFSSHWRPRHYHCFCTRAGHCHRRYSLYSDGCMGAIYHTVGLEGKNLTVWVMDCKLTIQDLSVHSQYSRHMVVQNKIGFDAMISVADDSSLRQA